MFGFGYIRYSFVCVCSFRSLEGVLEAFPDVKITGSVYRVDILVAVVLRDVTAGSYWQLLAVFLYDY